MTVYFRNGWTNTDGTKKNFIWQETNMKENVEEYTEDDTFRVLARPNIHEMVELHITWKRSITDEGKTFNSMWNISFMKYHGWGWIEYLIAKKAAGYAV